MSKEIVIENYSPEWPIVFQKLKSVYEQFAGDLVKEIHHVGSTSVEGLASKPVIDIDLIIESREALPQLIVALEKIGYNYMGDQGIEGREAFRQQTERTPEDGSERVWPVHHLYACTCDNNAFQNHIKFRDYLRQHPGKANEYGELKKQLASADSRNRKLYVEKKTAFIIHALREMGFDDVALKTIIDQNKEKQ